LSEYQYYEFQAIDRPLSEADRQDLRALSTRARITATSFNNYYEWGDFGGDPRKLVERWFDLHLYLANWGVRRLMVRLPKRLINRSPLNVFLGGVDWVEIWEQGENLIIDAYRDEAEQADSDWDDGSGWLAALTPLRADVLAGDFRLFYLLWLTAVEDEVLGDDETEPLSGIGPLSGALEAFADFFRIDPDLVQAAAEGDQGATMSSSAMGDVLAAIPEHEKTEFLSRLVEGDPHVAAELRARVRTLHAVPPTGRRTVGELRVRAAAIRRTRQLAEAERREAEQRQKTEEAERARRQRLDGVKRRGIDVWRDIEDEIERRNASGYERAADLLFDLQAIAEEQGTLSDFICRLEAIRQRHARKGRFIERLEGLGTR
jgi:hypothetical protein